MKNPAVVVVDVGGVGYEAAISSRTYDGLPEHGQSCFLYVQTVVREDAIHLFGFVKQEEKELFLHLITVSGIGPKLALTILSGIGVGELCQAIMAKDLPRLTALPGIGKKTAQRLCVELAEKVGGLHGLEVDGLGSLQTVRAGATEAMADAASALMNLGYSQAIAWQALRTIGADLSDAVEPLRVEELIRLALRFLVAR